MEIVTELEQVALSDKDIKKMIGKHGDLARVMLYNELADVQSLRDLFSEKINIVIILLSIEGPDAQPVGHWICMLDQQEQYEHFDSYGLTVDQELHITHEQPYLSQLMNAADKKVFQSTEQLQRIKEHTNTCGRYVVARAKNLHLTNAQFNAFIRSSETKPDIAVTLMTMYLLD